MSHMQLVHSWTDLGACGGGRMEPYASYNQACHNAVVLKKIKTFKKLFF